MNAKHYQLSLVTKYIIAQNPLRTQRNLTTYEAAVIRIFINTIERSIKPAMSWWSFEHWRQTSLACPRITNSRSKCVSFAQQMRNWVIDSPTQKHEWCTVGHDVPHRSLIKRSLYQNQVPLIGNESKIGLGFELRWFSIFIWVIGIWSRLGEQECVASRAEKN